MHRSIISERPDILFIETGSCSRRPGLCTVSVYIKSNVFAAPAVFLPLSWRQTFRYAILQDEPRRNERILRGLAAFAFYALVSLHERNRCIARTRGYRYGQQDRATNGLIFFVETFQTLFLPGSFYLYCFFHPVSLSKSSSFAENEILIWHVNSECHWSLVSSLLSF